MLSCKIFSRLYYNPRSFSVFDEDSKGLSVLFLGELVAALRRYVIFKQERLFTMGFFIDCLHLFCFNFRVNI
ncbi:MAG: hypothetical protein CV082_00435 [Candidatus Brocadia sp. BL1]|nr:MAG: hypothetical protein CV082_00435 [Candidatus Brocadia sp. BL1]